MSSFFNCWHSFTNIRIQVYNSNWLVVLFDYNIQTLNIRWQCNLSQFQLSFFAIYVVIMTSLLNKFCSTLHNERHTFYLQSAIFTYIWNKMNSTHKQVKHHQNIGSKYSFCFSFLLLFCLVYVIVLQFFH